MVLDDVPALMNKKKKSVSKCTTTGLAPALQGHSDKDALSLSSLQCGIKCFKSGNILILVLLE